MIKHIAWTNDSTKDPGSDMLEGAVVVIIDASNRVLLLLRPRVASWAPEKWALPGGKIEPGETAHHAAIRETKEETTLEVRDLKEVKLKIDKPVQAYYTRDYTGSVQIDYEHDDWTWVTRDKIENYLLAPQVLRMFDWVLKNE